MKILAVAAFATATILIPAPPAEAAGWRTCKTGKWQRCVTAPKKVEQTRIHRRAPAFHHRDRDFRTMSTREWFYRKMLDN